MAIFNSYVSHNQRVGWNSHQPEGNIDKQTVDSSQVVPTHPQMPCHSWDLKTSNLRKNKSVTIFYDSELYQPNGLQLYSYI